MGPTIFILRKSLFFSAFVYNLDVRRRMEAAGSENIQMEGGKSISFGKDFSVSHYKKMIPGSGVFAKKSDG